tara:strand:+ start:234 stop:473 length:240 start_codon:yes stop_codon:yes gene_type:complete
MDSISDLDLTEAASEPTYIVSGSGHAWYYSIEKKSMVMINRGATCLPLDDTESSEKILCQAGNEIVYIPAQEIIELGWN